MVRVAFSTPVHQQRQKKRRCKVQYKYGSLLVDEEVLDDVLLVVFIKNSYIINILRYFIQASYGNLKITLLNFTHRVLQLLILICTFV